MRFPNKVISYDESIFPIMVRIIELLSSEKLSVLTLFTRLKHYGYDNLANYIDSLDALFALKKIKLSNESEELSLC